MSWRPPAKKQITRLERLKEIRARSYARGEQSRQMYPRNVNKPKTKQDKQEYNDYYWLAQLKKKLNKLSSEELLIYEEMQVWKQKRKRHAQHPLRKKAKYYNDAEMQVKPEMKLEPNMISLPPQLPDFFWGK
eukprot:UN33354